MYAKLLMQQSIFVWGLFVLMQVRRRRAEVSRSRMDYCDHPQGLQGARATVKYETALALFAAMSLDQQEAVVRVFDGIRGGFTDVRDAFIEAVTDEAYVIETEMLLLAARPAAGMLQ